MTPFEPADEAGFFMPGDQVEPLGMPEEEPALPMDGPLMGLEEPDLGTEDDAAAWQTMDPGLLTEDERRMRSEWQGADWATTDARDHEANLAQWMGERQLDRLAMRVIDWVRVDKESRRDWEDREAKGIVALGVTSQVLGGVQAVDPSAAWASTAVHPGLVKACIQFQARAVAELWPSGGPVKAVVLGDATPEREQQADRVAGFLNYLYEEEMPDAFDEHDQMLFRLPLSGSCFKKVYFDPLEGTLCSRFVESADFVKPYSAVNLRSAPRFTHIVKLSRNETRRLMAEGVYLEDVNLGDPDDEGQDQTTLDRTIDDAGGIVPTQDQADNDAEQDQRDELYECYATLDLDDYDYRDPLGEAYGLPYVVTVHKTAQKVLAIRRNWHPEDVRKRRRLFFREYKFLPGLGGYGFGFLHIAGGLSDTSTGALRALLDSAVLANLRGGYVSQDVVGLHDLPPIVPGKWLRVPNSAEDLNKAFWSPDYEEPSQVLFNLLGYLDEQFGSLVSTTETLVGEDNNNTPVGTVLARIEQGLKVFSGIHRRCHTAQRAEFRIVADLAAAYLPEVYPYDVPGESRAVYAADFDDRVDVLPVSDPNIISNTQRMAQAQGIWELAVSAPEIFDVRRAARGMLEAMRVPDIDEYLLPEPEPVDPNQPAPVDPVTEAKLRETDAKIMREDARAVAEIEGKQAQAQMKADGMRRDAATEATGDAARIAAAGNGELKRLEEEILQAAEARRMQQARDVAGRGLEALV
jgi:hypothetical protein